MIIWITGAAGSGKSIIMREVLKKININKNIFTLNKSSTLDNYREKRENFISLIKENYKKYDHFIFEGLKWSSSRYVILNEFIKLKYDFKIFYLDVPKKIINQRRKERGRPREKKISIEQLDKEFIKSKIHNDLLIKNKYFSKNIKVRNNINHNDLNLITKEIYELIKD